MSDESLHDAADDFDEPVMESEDRPVRAPSTYERRLRHENAKWREKFRQAEDAMNAMKADGEAKLAALKAERDAAIAAEKAERDRLLADVAKKSEKAVTDAQSASRDRIIKAEVRAEAIRAGLVHTKGLDMLDFSEATLDDDGNLALPEGFFEKAKADMPFLFSEPKAEAPRPTDTTRVVAPGPRPIAPTGRRATELTADEYRAGLAEIMRTGRVPE